MPELPEVQTVVNHLAQKIIGKVFSVCRVKVAKMVNAGFQQKIKGKRIIAVSRRGKMIVIELQDNVFLLIHLKMTGQLIYADNNGNIAGGGHPIDAQGFILNRPNKFTRIILDFKDASRLLFHDVRKFGWMKIVNLGEYHRIIGQYGFEPLSREFTLNKFKEILKKRPNLKIKQLLMLQELIAGIGNIYADESLYESRISPLRPSKSLKQPEIQKLHQAVIKLLKQAIKLGGTSVNTFVSSSGERGSFAEKLQVYQRGKGKCHNCGNPLKRIKIGGRGTVYCPKCQK